MEETWIVAAEDGDGEAAWRLTVEGEWGLDTEQVVVTVGDTACETIVRLTRREALDLAEALLAASEWLGELSGEICDAEE